MPRRNLSATLSAVIGTELKYDGALRIRYLDAQVCYPPVGMLVGLAAPPDNNRGPRFMQEALAAIHQANRERAPLVFEFASHDRRVGLFVRMPDDLAPLVAGPLKAKYPNCTLTVLEDEDALAPVLPSPSDTWFAEVALVPDLFPLLRHSQFEDIAGGGFEDPIDALLQSITPDDHTQGHIQIHIRPTSRRRHRWARRAVARLDSARLRTSDERSAFYARWIMHPFCWPVAWLCTSKARPTEVRSHSQIDTTAGRHHEREDDVQAASDKVGGHLFDARIRLVIYASKGADRNAQNRLHSMLGALGSFTASRLATFRVVRRGRGSPKPFRRGPFLLSHEELATLFHSPTANVAIETMRTSDFTELEAPPAFDSKESEQAVTLGRVRFRDDNRRVTLGAEARRRHLYIAGRTGVGKSTLLLNMLMADIQQGRGVGLLDPHGDLAESVLAAVPSHRTNSVIVFDPSDAEYSIGFNPLACFDPAKRDLVADDVLSAFSKVYDLSQTPRLKDTLRNALYVLIEQGETLVGLLLLLSDEAYRSHLVREVDDDVARLFWQREFPSWNQRYRAEACSAIQNKVRPFLMNRNVRAIVGQKGRTLNLRNVMDEAKVLIVNLSKGKIGEDNANLLGALLVSSIQQAAMSRADTPEDERRDFYLTVDEFQNYRTGSFPSILSEARKYRLCLTVAHQYLRQLDLDTQNAVFGNVGSFITFQAGGDDADILAGQLSQFPGQVRPADIANLPKYTAYARLLIDGMPSRPFSLQTLPPPEPCDEGRAAVVRTASRRRHAVPADRVHQQIRKSFAGIQSA